MTESPSPSPGSSTASESEVDVSWIVRTTARGPDVEAITIAATMADADGCAEVTDPRMPNTITLLVGFAERTDADRFAATFPGSSVESVDPSLWMNSQVETLTFGSDSIELEIGGAFGHGRHPTTALALDAIERLGGGEGRTMLDVGCGTGVLSIAAAMRGWTASGCDIDADSVGVAVRNAERNGVGDSVSFVTASPVQLATPEWLKYSAGFDVAAVNTLVGVHEEIGSAVSTLISPIGSVIITGVQGQEQLLRAIESYPGWHERDRYRSGPWLLAELYRP